MNTSRSEFISEYDWFSFGSENGDADLQSAK
jgi:hypothetical protein